MTISSTKQIKVLLLLAGYLFVVLIHIAFVQPQKVNNGKLASNGFVFVSKNHDKFGKGIINVKKIYKTIINRSYPDKKVIPSELYVATLLYDVSSHTIQADKNCVYSIPLRQLPAKHNYHLRI